MGGKGDGIQKHRRAVTKQSRDVKYRTGSTVNDMVITLYGVGGH